MIAFCTSSTRVALVHHTNNAFRRCITIRRNPQFHTTRTLTTTMIRGFPNNFSGGGGPGGRGSNTGFDVLEYPCVFTFKVIGERQGDFMNDIVDSVAGALSTDKTNLKTSFRDHGKWRSISIRAVLGSKEDIYTVYAAISRDPRVKFKF